MVDVAQHVQAVVVAVAQGIVEVNVMVHALGHADMVVLEVAEEGLCLWFIRGKLLKR